MTKSSSNKFEVAIVGLRIFAVALALLQGYTHRFTVYDDDAISYLDIASAYLRGDWTNAINGYWSPLYSWLIAAGLAIFRPTPFWEFAFLKALNFVTFIFLIGCFEYFLKAVSALQEKRVQAGEYANFYVPSANLVKLNLYIAFIFINLSYGGVYQDTPDFLLSAFVLLASALLLEYRFTAAKLSTLVAMAASLAFAYLSKAVAFPLALYYFFLVAVSSTSYKAGLKQSALSLGVFLLLAGPFVAALSNHYGHLTFSETGKIAYCEAVSQSVPFLHPLFSKNLADGCHHLLHPSRVIFDEPKVFEFAEPVQGTFPVWYDPSYWYAGCEIKYSNLKQFIASFCSAWVYIKLFFGPLFIAWLLMVIVARQPGLSIKLWARNFLVYSPGLVALTCYLIGVNLNQVYPFTYRYLPAYFMLILAGLALSLKLKDNVASRRGVLTAFVTANICFFVPLVIQTAGDLGLLLQKQNNVHWEVAHALDGLNIKPGDRVASLDNRRQYYWARLAGLKIVAEIFDIDSFFKDYPDRAQKISTKLKEFGVKAIVLSPGHPLPSQAKNSGWIKVLDGENSSYVFLLDKP